MKPLPQKKLEIYTARSDPKDVLSMVSTFEVSKNAKVN